MSFHHGAFSYITVLEFRFSALKLSNRPPKYPIIYPEYPLIKDHKGSIKGPLGGPLW